MLFFLSLLQIVIFDSHSTENAFESQKDINYNSKSIFYKNWSNAVLLNISNFQNEKKSENI